MTPRGQRPSFSAETETQPNCVRPVHTHTHTHTRTHTHADIMNKYNMSQDECVAQYGGIGNHTKKRAKLLRDAKDAKGTTLQGE